MTAAPVSRPAPFARAIRPALAAGVGGVGLAAALGAVRVGDFWFPYLFAFHLCLGLGWGAAAILMIHRLTGGRWGACVRRPLEAMTATLPVLMLLLVPALLGMDQLYPWLGEATERVVRDKQAYLNRPFFLLRAACYAVVWSAVAVVLVWRGRGGEADATAGRQRAQTRFAAVALIAHVVTMGFAAIDWIGSLEPRWYSSIFGIHVAVGHTLGAMALLVAIACAAAMSLPEVGEVVRDRLHDLGNLLLLLVAFDAYVSFVQVLIAWNGNLPHHVVWFVPRTAGVWGAAGVAMVVLQLALPLFALFFRAVKRRPRALLAVAVLVLIGRVIDSAWQVLPSSERRSAADLGIAAAAALGVGGLWTAAFLWQCDRRLEVAR